MSPVSTGLRHPDWAQRASIRGFTLRQFTTEGTRAAFQRHLPRRRERDVDILWLMPVQPIGAKHRQRTPGSRCSVSDRCAVNPECGSLVDFKRLVRGARDSGMRALLDRVADHTARDHRRTTEHPDGYLMDSRGEIHSGVDDMGKPPEHRTEVVGHISASPRDMAIAGLERRGQLPPRVWRIDV